mmetsp:Transcript_65937/g.118868  ORF Transcript_65937/g.118868 Transcript_65937/m.118868 type:complete len:83 (-) Transcript_65937:153-401(-)
MIPFRRGNALCDIWFCSVDFGAFRFTLQFGDGFFFGCGGGSHFTVNLLSLVPCSFGVGRRADTLRRGLRPQLMRDVLAGSLA